MDKLGKLVYKLYEVVMKIVEAVVRANLELLYSTFVILVLATCNYCTVLGYLLYLRFLSCAEEEKDCPTPRVVLASNVCGAAGVLLLAYIIYHTFFRKPEPERRRR